MGRRRCCCGCLIEWDNFNDRTNGAVPVDDRLWKDVDEVWSFSSGTLLVNTGEEGPIIMQPRTHRLPRYPDTSDADYNYMIKFTALNIGTPTEAEPDLIDEFGVIVRYEGSTSYDWVKFEWDETNSYLWPSFMRNTSVLMDKTTHPAGEGLRRLPDGSFAGQICYADVEWSVTEQDSPPVHEYPWTMCGGGANASHRVTGYGFVGFLYGHFDDVELWDHWEVDPDNCPYCSCFCVHPSDEEDYACLPEWIAGTIVPMHSTSEYSAPNIDYKEFLLQQTVNTWSAQPPLVDKAPSKRRWRITGVLDSGYHYEDTMWLTCDERDFYLTSMFEDGGLGLTWTPVEGDSGKEVDWTSSICKPLFMVFSSLQATVTDRPGAGYIQLEADPDSDVIADTPANRTYLQSLRWRIELAEGTAP